MVTVLFPNKIKIEAAIVPQLEVQLGKVLILLEVFQYYYIRSNDDS